MTTLTTTRPSSSPPPAPPTRPPQRRRPWRLLAYVGLTAGALVMMYPIIWMLFSSVKPENEIFAQVSLWPQQFEFGNYVDGWFGGREDFGYYLINSFIVCAGAVIGNLVACTMAAYAFARLEFKWKPFWFAVMLGTIMLPFHVTLIPQYSLFFNLDWVNTYLPLIVPKFLATDAFFIFLLIQFIRGLPTELDQAAKIDGCGPFQVFLRVILPLLRPALVTVAIFTFLWTYNDFFSQLIYISDAALYTVPLALRMFLDSSGESAWGPMFAMSVISLVPMFIFFIAFQRHIVEGISTTGLKG